jgi:uncharacterized membrane protein
MEPIERERVKHFCFASLLSNTRSDIAGLIEGGLRVAPAMNFHLAYTNPLQHFAYVKEGIEDERKSYMLFPS